MTDVRCGSGSSPGGSVEPNTIGWVLIQAKIPINEAMPATKRRRRTNGDADEAGHDRRDRTHPESAQEPSRPQPQRDSGHWTDLLQLWEAVQG